MQYMYTTYTIYTTVGNVLVWYMVYANKWAYIGCMRMIWKCQPNKLAKLRRCVRQVSFGSKKFGPSKLLNWTNLQK